MTKLIGGLVAAGALVVGLAAPAQAGEDRGWIFGGGLTGGHLGFTNTAGRGVAVGSVDGYEVLPYGGPILEHRNLQVFDPNTPPAAGTEWTVPFPTSAGGAGISMHFGYAFSPGVAVLADFEVLAPISEGFNQVVGAAVVRYSPASRIWLEAGPAGSDLRYGYHGGVADGDIGGAGVMAAVGVNVVQKPKWTLGLQARYSRMWYDGFETSSLSFGVSAGRVRSGKPAPRAEVR
jgi:hypothetical protein